jgi:hypothetical protein
VALQGALRLERSTGSSEPTFPYVKASLQPFAL